MPQHSEVRAVSPDDVISWQALRDEANARRFSERATAERSPVIPKTPNQAAYCQAMCQQHIVFCGGPSGAGKTLLGLNAGVQALKLGLVDQLMVVRPAVTVGGGLGFMPGTLAEKMAVFTVAVRRQLGKILSPEELVAWEKSEKVTYDAVQYMRGDSLDRRFVLVDEAQNLNRVEMNMLLTRIEGGNTRMVLNGDADQVDIPNSFFEAALRKFDGRDGDIAVVRMGPEDIMRSRLVRVVVGIMSEPD